MNTFYLQRICRVMIIYQHEISDQAFGGKLETWYCWFHVTLATTVNKEFSFLPPRNKMWMGSTKIFRLKEKSIRAGRTQSN